jgi:hypothetical protein
MVLHLNFHKFILNVLKRRIIKIFNPVLQDQYEKTLKHFSSWIHSLDELVFISSFF